MQRFINLLPILTLAIVCNPLTATTQDSGSQTIQHSTLPAKADSHALKISAGDLLEISVFDAPELTQQVRVGSDGTAGLALLGNVPIAGLTGQQASDKIATELRDRSLLLHPQVSVLIKEFSSQGVSVIGEVQHAGVYQILGPRTLLDVLSMAGGLTNVADSRVTIKHRDKAEESVSVKLRNDDPKSSLASNVAIYPGDLVLVPRAGVVYVLGDVTHPGGFVMQDNGKITALQVLAQAGGPSPTAALNRAVWLRKSGDSFVRSELPLEKISRGQQNDVELQANDVVFVPNSRWKNALKNTQSIAESIGSASIYAIVH
jgi:polysaccharide export outer membrane protein